MMMATSPVQSLFDIASTYRKCVAVATSYMPEGLIVGRRDPFPVLLYTYNRSIHSQTSMGLAGFPFFCDGFSKILGF